METFHRKIISIRRFEPGTLSYPTELREVEPTRFEWGMCVSVMQDGGQLRRGDIRRETLDKVVLALIEKGTRVIQVCLMHALK